VDYALWDQVGAAFLLTGRIEMSAGRAELVTEVHDVVYREVRGRGRFPLPAPDTPDFRMAVHVASDAAVEWATGEPGIAASRIVFSRQGDAGNRELWVVDSDGENLRRVTNHNSLAITPAWSPDGRRIAFTSYISGLPRIYELELATGRERMVPAPRSGDYITPAYAPDGETLAFAITGSAGRSGLYSYNIVRECCFTTLSESRNEDLSPSFAPDGRRLAFFSNRLGVGTPQIYLMPAGGGSAEILSPYRFDRPGYYSSPDWSPRGDRVAYYGRIERIGWHQILISEVGRGNRILQLTRSGNNEDPSWAPDGRHLVYTSGSGRGGANALRIVDAVTGNTRTLVSGFDVKYPDWSPSLAGLVPPQEDRYARPGCPWATRFRGRAGLGAGAPRVPPAAASGRAQTGVGPGAEPVAESRRFGYMNTGVSFPAGRRGRRGIRHLAHRPVRSSPLFRSHDASPPSSHGCRDSRRGFGVRLPPRSAGAPRPAAAAARRARTGPGLPACLPGFRRPGAEAARMEAERQRRIEAARATLTAMVNFDYDDSSIRSDMEPILRQKVEILRSSPNVRLRLEGHTDERGSGEYNLALGSRRAQSVLNFFRDSGISENRFETTSYGEERPLVNRSDEAAWAQNRRVEFIIIAGNDQINPPGQD
jgi:TolB protein